MLNNLLELKGAFNHNDNPNRPGPVSLPQNAQDNPITLEHLTKLINQLQNIYEYWSKETLINGALITVFCREIIAKSNRLGRLLKENQTLQNSNIRGSRFNEDFTKHIFTYFISLDALLKSITELQKVAIIVEKNFNGKIFKKDIDNIKSMNIDHSIIPYTVFAQIIKDAYYVENFDIARDVEEVKKTSIISLYKTGVDTKTLLRKLGINLIDEKMLDDTTIRLTPDEISILQDKAAYLIAMKTVDISKLKKEEVFKNDLLTNHLIPQPQNEPIIGVIDTLFDNRVYFSDWVEYVDMVDENIPKTSEDYFHGTSVSSIIVDGPSINPDLNDGCGRFRVKHFGVATSSEFSSFSILKSIRIAVQENPNIKVWNLSLGSSLEINPNFISPEGAELDKIQSEYNVVFVISGTNKPYGINDIMKIGAPADSINSIVVNSVNKQNQPASYHRVGPVLSFFYKPDISYYGGDSDKKIKVCSNTGEYFVTGTSFAAPWISRKLAYLIQILGFSREVAKALLIDAAAGWNRQDTLKCDIGYGVVPINIKDIVSSKNDEIKFVFNGSTELYETMAYNIPIPLDNDKNYPYITRATLCYYPKCSRSQGVDYTDTEIDFQFGRVNKNNKNRYELKTFNGNTQGSIGDSTREKAARENWRKWDNIKHIATWGKQSNRVKKSYDGELCGVKMTVKDRLSSQHNTIPFGIVVTLKEINGVNRISDFIKMCNIKGWYVNQVDINNRISLINKAEEEIVFD